MTSAPEAWLEHFDVSDPEHVVETAIADVWKLQLATGRFAALKIYKDMTIGNEAAGLRFMKALRGGAVVDVLAQHKNAVLLEWLPGRTLGDLVRDGQDAFASQELVNVALRLRRQIKSLPSAEAARLPKLEEWFEDLFAVQFHDTCPPEARQHMRRSQEIARELLAAQRDVGPLHGDLHHDNVKETERGFCAFDAKGVVGERAYELANAFRNPTGAGQLIRDPARTFGLLDLWSATFEVERRRLMQWATVKSALSISWRAGPMIQADGEFDVMALFLDTLDDLSD